MRSKIIKDLAYGYVQIDENVAKIIDNRSFQRLKNISQLTAHHVFPSANHTRFEHSLGVMHLSLQFADVLEKELIQEQITCDKIHLKYAALLHDVGHAPMSHVGEAFYNKEDIAAKILELYPDEGQECFNKGSAHEMMSCYVIAKNFRKDLREIFSEFHVELDLGYIFRIITGSKYQSQNRWNRNLMIEILNSNTIDVDKIDYLIRDNLMAGGVAPAINLDRLLFSLRIDSMHKIAFSTVGISSVVSVIDSRDFLYLWLYNHHIVVYTDYLYKTAIEHLSNDENKISTKKIKLNDYFSCEAIAEQYVTDDDIRVVLNAEYSNTESIYSKKILSQLFERRFLKPLWKTIYEFNNFMYDKANFDDRQKDEILKLIGSGRLKTITSQLLKECQLDPGDLFIIERSNKFYAMNNKTEFYIYSPKSGDTKLSSIMPERRFDEHYSNIAFYVFTLPEKVDEVKPKLVSILKSSGL